MAASGGEGEQHSPHLTSPRRERWGFTVLWNGLSLSLGELCVTELILSTGRRLFSHRHTVRGSWKTHTVAKSKGAGAQSRRVEVLWDQSVNGRNPNTEG